MTEFEKLRGKPLSPREVELNGHLSGDKTIREIALEMELAYYTTKYMAQRIYAKREVFGRVGLMAARIAELENGTG